MITSIHIENYKSLEKVDLQLGGLNVLVGPNNAGKSNILDAFAFIGELAREGTPVVESRGGFANLVFQGDTKRTISFRIKGKWSAAVNAAGKGYQYELQLVGGPRHWRISQDLFSIVDVTGNLVHVLERKDNASQFSVFSELGESVMQWSMGRLDKPALSYLVGVDEPRCPPILAAFANEVTIWDRFQLAPILMRKPAPIRRDLLLSRQGENLATILHELYTRHRGLFQEIETTLQAMVPEIRNLMVATGEPGQTYVEVLEESSQFPVPAWSLADGVLKLLGLLSLVYSPGSPALVCMEEPENFLHPHALKIAVDAIRSGRKERQFVFSTHSPLLLDLIEVGELRVVEKTKGRTVARKISGRKDLVAALKSLGLGEAWYAGHIGGIPA